MTKPITYGSIVPLIGGENLGIMESLDGQLPEWMLSYSPFKNNDAHLVNYLRTQKGWEGEFTLLDENPDTNPGYVDVVNAVCPCSGLSSLSRTSSADSETNEWMYTTTEYVLGTIQPQVFWGENAPRLYSDSGKPVADRLHAIAEENGYSLTLYQTMSQLHGIAQKRPRTFYFFTKGNHEAPIFKYFRRPMENVQDILTKEDRPDDPMDVVMSPHGRPYDNPWLRYCMYKAGVDTVYDFYEYLDESTNCIYRADKVSENLNEVGDWMDLMEFNEKFGNRARAMQEKLDQGKGYWGHGITVPKNGIPSFIGVQPHYMVNPFRESYVTFRDGLRIMKHPDDFNMVVDENKGYPSQPNHMCQNVPVTTARDMMDAVLEYLDGQCDKVNGSLVKQTNVKMQHHVITKEVNDLDQFLG